MAGLTERDNLERVERFVSLAPGQYWKVCSDTGYAEISVGQVLLISAIDDADGSPHTVHVRLHPSVVQSTHRVGVKFLVEDFLAFFEHVEEEAAKHIRNEEIKQIQQRLGNAQEELQRACSDTALLDSLIEQQDAKVDEKGPQLPAVRDALPGAIVRAVQTQEVTSLMSPGLTEVGVAKIKQAMSHHRDLAVKRADWISKQTQLLSAIASEMTPFFEEQAAVAMAQTKDMRDHVTELMKGVDTLNLYTLKGVLIDTLVSGESAPADVPLTVMQQVLYMDEELAVYEPVHDEWDCTDRAGFFEALPRHPQLIEQLFTSERCIIGMATTRHKINYLAMGRGIAEASELAAENAKVFFLIRDGENLHVVQSAEVFHTFIPRLFPSKNQMEKPFRGFDGSRITYSDIRYTSAMKEYDAIALGYKRLLILLCGLDHAKQLFGPFYEGEPSLNFVSLEFQERYFNFVHDDDGEGLIGTHRPVPFEQWLHGHNKAITSGSTILGVWRDLFSVDSIPSAYERENMHKRRSELQLIYSPEGDYVSGVVKRTKGQLILPVALSGYNANFEQREFFGQLQLSETLKYAEKSYICLDCVAPKELNWYLHDRRTRQLNVKGIRLIKLALEHIQHIHQRESAVRSELKAALLSGNICDESQSATLINIACGRWRCSHPGKELSSLLEDKRGFNALLDQLYQLSDVSEDLTSNVMREEQQAGRSPIRITITSNGQYCAYSQPTTVERDDRLIADYWVVRTRYKQSKSGIVRQPSTRVLLTEVIAKETVVYEVDDVQPLLPPEKAQFKSPKYKADFINSIEQSNATLDSIKCLLRDADELPRFIEHYLAVRRELSSESVVEPVVTVMLGACVVADEAGFVVLRTSAIDLLAYITVGLPETRSRVRQAIARHYKHPESICEQFDGLVKKYTDKPLGALFNLFFSTSIKPPEGLLDDIEGIRSIEHLNGALWSFEAALSRTKLADSWGRRSSRPFKFVPLDMTPKALDFELGVTKPDNFAPCLVVENYRTSLDEGRVDIYEYSEACHDYFSRQKVKVFDSFDEVSMHYQNQRITVMKQDTGVLCCLRMEATESQPEESGFKCMGSWKLKYQELD